jgi:hypothetical protein
MSNGYGPADGTLIFEGLRWVKDESRAYVVDSEDDADPL